MSWLARSIANTLKGEEEDESNQKGKDEVNEDPTTTTRGVKEDLSELTETLTRQFWGVASFLAPSALSDPSNPTVENDSSNLAGIRNDLAEFGGKFRSGIEKISNAKAVSEISKLASSLLMAGNENDGDFEKESNGVVVGIDDEIIEFVRSVSMHPEIWLDFPLEYDEEEDDDNDEFDMSNSQQENALAVERLVPALASLRIELCPSHLSEGHFWKIYFLLLHSRFSKKDAELLMTPQIEQARAMLLLAMRNHLNPDVSERAATSEMSVAAVTSNPSEENLISQSNNFTENHTSDDHSTSTLTIDPKPTLNYVSERYATNGQSVGAVASIPTGESLISSSTNSTMNLTTDEAFTSIPIMDIVETEKHPISTNEVEIVDKSVIQESDNTISIQKYEVENDEWLQEEEEIGEAGDAQRGDVQVINDEDVSFSDLEDDDDDPAISKNL